MHPSLSWRRRPCAWERCPPDAIGPRRRAGVPMAARLAAESEPCDDGPVPRVVLLDQVGEKASPMAHELEEAAARMVVLGERLQVLRQVLDPLRQERDLDLGGPGIALDPGVLGDHLLLHLPRERHSVLRHELFLTFTTSTNGRMVSGRRPSGKPD